MTYADRDGILREDRRDGFRRRALLKARACFQDGFCVYDTTIRNLSVTGARLSFALPTPMPDRFELRWENIRRWVRVVWRRGDDMGVAFD